MITSDNLKSILKEIYGIEEKYIVPLNSGWFAPTVDLKETKGTWIGYRINSIKPYTRAYSDKHAYVKPVKIAFRVTFVGHQAEEFAHQTMMWEDRADVTKVFEKYQAQVNYNERDIYTFPIKNQGFNDMLAWIVDFTVQTAYEVNTNWKPWLRANG